MCKSPCKALIGIGLPVNMCIGDMNLCNINNFMLVMCVYACACMLVQDKFNYGCCKAKAKLLLLFRCM